MTRPRRRQGAPGGFTVVDPGGNWLRISRHRDTDDEPAASTGRLARVVAAAARQADSHGDESAGIRVLETGLARHADAPPAQRLPALVYLAELRLALELSAADREALATDLATPAELAADVRSRMTSDSQPAAGGATVQGPPTTVMPLDEEQTVREWHQRRAQHDSQRTGRARVTGARSG
jgi:hypothetical protein